MKKIIFTLLIFLIFSSLYSSIFILMDLPYSLGIGYKDNNSFIRLSDKDLGFSVKTQIYEMIEPFIAVNFKLRDPLFNNDVQLSLKLNFQNIDLGIGLWSSLSNFKKSTDSGIAFDHPLWNYWIDEFDSNEDYIGHLGLNAFLNLRIGRIITGANLSTRVYNIIQEDDNLNFIFAAFPEDLANIRNFSGYIGFNLLENEDFDLQFYLNVPAYYSVIPGGMVFFRVNSYYTFTIRLNIKNF